MDGWSDVGPVESRRQRDAAPHMQATLPSADHAAEVARLQRENERLRMERDFSTNFPGPLRACVRRNSRVPHD